MTLKNHTNSARNYVARLFHDFSVRQSKKRRTEADERINGREEARIDRSNCENEEEEDDVLAGWLAGPPAGSGRALV